jgi:hypothetical protein
MPAQYAGKTVALRRGGCTFKTKVQFCQQVNASAVIVVNDELDFPIEMSLGSAANDPMARYDDETLEPNGIGIPTCTCRVASPQVHRRDRLSTESVLDVFSAVALGSEHLLCTRNNADTRR